MPKSFHHAALLIAAAVLPLLQADDFHSPGLVLANTGNLTRGSSAARPVKKLEITVPPITPVHPRILLTPADVAAIKQAIGAHAEPRYSAWLNLKSRADRLIRPPVDLPYTGRDSLMFYNVAKGAGNRASHLALAFLLNGNPAYAAKSKEILLAWARAAPLPASRFAPEIRFVSSGMDTARGMIGFIYAYDCLYNSLLPAERTAVEAWLRAMLPGIRDGIARWNTPYKGTKNDPRGWVESPDPKQSYFGGQFYQNHLVSHTMGVLLIGYALGDRELVQFAVDSPDNPRDLLELFEGMILMAGDPVVGNVDTMNPPPQDGEIIDRYRHINPPGLGLGYSTLALNQMMVMAEVLFANGLDFYQRKGGHGETLEQPFNFYADFFRLGDASIKGGFYKGEAVAKGGPQVAVFEVANQRYPGNPEIGALLHSVNRAAVDPNGSEETYLCFPTLIHGVGLQPQRVAGK